LKRLRRSFHLDQKPATHVHHKVWYLAYINDIQFILINLSKIL
jgi:hypothetical protein